MKKLIAASAVFAAFYATSEAKANWVFGIDVSDYQGTVTWSKVYASGVKFAFAKATTGYDYSEQSHFKTDMTSGKSAGLLMGAYHFSHPQANTPAQEASYFWNFASPEISADGKSLDPMIDFEVYDGTYGGESYTSFFNDWSTDVKGKTTAFMHPVIYSSAGAGMCDLSTSCTLSAWVANYNGEDLYTGNPWTCCDSCNFVDPNTENDWTYWQVSSTGSIGGISGAVDLDAYGATSVALLKTNQGVGE
jgi:lysozyme